MGSDAERTQSTHSQQRARSETEAMIQRGRVAALVLAAGLLVSFGSDRSVGVTIAVALLAANVVVVQFVLRRNPGRRTVRAVGWGSFAADAVVCATALAAVTEDPVDPISAITVMLALEAAVRWGSRGAILGGLLGGAMAAAWAAASYASVGRELPATSVAFRMLSVVVIALPVGLLIQRLRGQQEHTRRLFDLSSDVIVVVEDGRVVAANPSACALARTSAAEVTDGPWADRFGALFDLDLDVLLHASCDRPRRVPVPGADDEQRWFTVQAETTENTGLVFVTARDVTRERRREEDLRHRAWHDPLTGLPNRAALRSRLTARLSETTGVGLVFLDLDDFKQVNDTLGHVVGDDVLVEVADRLRQVTRVGDAAYRWAGDEFCVVVDPAEGGGLAAIGRRIAAVFDHGFQVGEGTVDVHASVGTALARPGDDVDTLLARADRQMYRHKGRRESPSLESRGTR